MTPLFLAIVGVATLIGALTGLAKSDSTKYFVYISLLLLPLDIFRLNTEPFTLSLFRMFLISAISCHIISKFMSFYPYKNDIIKIRRILIFTTISIVLFFLSLVLSIVTATEPQHGIQLLFSNVFGILLVMVIISTISNQNEFLYYLRAIFASYTIPIIFMIYTYYIWVVHGEYVRDIPFRETIPFEMGAGGHLQRFPAVFEDTTIPRQALPFSSPPHLSMFLVIGIFICVWYIVTARSRHRSILASIYGVMLFFSLLLTVSRSGVFTFIIVGGIGLLFSLRKSKKLLKYLFGYGLIISFIVIIILPEQILLARFTESIAGHLNSRIRGLSLWLSDAHTVLFGVGLDNYIIHTGTNTPETNYVKFLAERGIIGTLLAAPIYILPAVILSRNLSNSPYRSQTYLMNLIWLCIVLSFFVGELFYDFVQARFVWAFLGMAIAAGINFSPTETEGYSLNGVSE